MILLDLNLDFRLIYNNILVLLSTILVNVNRDRTLRWLWRWRRIRPFYIKQSAQNLAEFLWSKASGRNRGFLRPLEISKSTIDTINNGFDNTRTVFPEFQH